MLLHYIRMAWRNMIRGKGYSAINISGLAIGITAFLIIMLYIKNELSFDRFHRNSSRIYRVGIDFKSKEGTMRSPQITAAILPDLMLTCPEIENSVRLRSLQNGYISYGNRSIYQEAILYADSSFFGVFSFCLLKGNPRKVLSDPYSIVLTGSEATNLFRDKDPMGKMVSYEGKSYLVTGIAEDPPLNSHIRFTSIISFLTLYNDSRLYMGWNGGMQYYGYILLHKNSSLENLKNKFPKLLYEKINREMESSGESWSLFLDPLTSIYLFSGLPGEIGPSGNLQGIKIFTVVAFFILIIACFNFININLSLAFARNHETGIRKINGATRPELVSQFVLEIFLQVLLACILAFLLAELMLSQVNSLLGKNLTLLGQFDLFNFLIILVLLLLVTLLSGIFPAWFIASFSPAGVIKGNVITLGPHSYLRNILVGLQFLITGLLLVSTSIIFLQMRFIRQKDLGYEKENILVIPLSGDQVKSKAELYRNELASIPEIEAVSAASEFPGHGYTSNGYVPEGRKEPIMINVVDVDENYLKALGLSVAKGRNFSTEFPTDKKAYLINEALAKQMGWGDPIGKRISRGGDHTIIGVVKDFHFASLHNQIGPLIFTMEPYMGFDYIIAKISKGRVPEAMKNADHTWQRLFPGTLFRYSFLDQEFDRTYRTEQAYGRLMLFFSILAMVIALMGLFGLASLRTARRTKEIGIRKVMGASINKIMGMLLGEFGLLVFAANLLMWPIAWLLAERWLQEYAYHVKLNIWPFLAVLVIMLILAAIAVGRKAYQAARNDPAITLRYE